MNMAIPAQVGSKKRSKRDTMPNTEYSVYATCDDASEDDKKKLIDFTEQRLCWLIDRTLNVKKQMMLIALLHDYRKRDVAIAWRSGNPVFIRLGDDKEKSAK